MNSPLLQVSGLKTWIGERTRPLRAVDGVDFTIHRGETFALVGESGCGKSMTALSLLRLNPYPASQIVAGEVKLNDVDLLHLTEAEMQSVRGRKIAMIFQEPQSSLNPVMTIGEQIAECLRRHQTSPTNKFTSRILSLLESVGIADPQRRIHAYPHQLSGGMKQRVMIALALAGEPELLIADEPTTALDVTIQAQILTMLKDIQAKTGMAVLLISHDLAVVSQMADHVAVMYAGQIIESAPRALFFQHYQHPYTQKLFDALPAEHKRQQRLTVIKGTVPSLDQIPPGCRFADRCDSAWERCRTEQPKWIMHQGHGVRCHLYDSDADTEHVLVERSGSSSPLSEVIPAKTPVLELKNVCVYFPVRKGIFQRTVGHIKAVDGITLTLHQAETVALVGESGCGKSTVAKGILQLIPVTAGEICFRETNLVPLSERELRPYRSAIQMIFQDPFSAMNPRMTIRQIITEAIPPEITQQDKHIESLLQRVGLSPDIKHRYPHEFSGGQRQRICIARALATHPDIIICDEPTSALDVSVQAQILNLMRDIQHEFGLSYLFITHNMAVVNYLAHRVAVMYLGRIVEQGPREAILHDPKHPYTQALLASVPDIERDNIISRPLQGELPSPAHPPKGCHFHQRCPHAMPVCGEHYPQRHVVDESHEVYCFLYQESEHE